MPGTMSNVSFGFHQPRCCSLGRCCTQHRRQRVSERQLLYGHVLWASLATASRNARRRIWHDLDGDPKWMFYTSQLHRKAVLPAQTFMMSKTTNVFTTITRGKAMSLDTLQTLLSYAQTGEEDYTAYVIHAHMMEIVDDLMASNCLATHCKKPV